MCICVRTCTDREEYQSDTPRGQAAVLLTRLHGQVTPNRTKLWLPWLPPQGLRIYVHLEKQLHPGRFLLSLFLFSPPNPQGNLFYSFTFCLLPQATKAHGQVRGVR